MSVIEGVYALENWFDLAKESRRSANELMVAGCYRSTISRAYYAAYAKVTFGMAALGVSTPIGKEGPTHKNIGKLVVDRFLAMEEKKRSALSSILGQLYALRIRADYRPSEPIDSRDARESIALMKKIFDSF